MTSIGTIQWRAGYKWIAVLLFTCAISLLNASEARAEDRCVADLGGVIDGFVTPNPPAQVQIDGNCIVRNFPASNPLRTNFSFYTAPGQTDQRWLIIFDNVVHTGNMSCNSVQGHHIWFTNGSSSKIKQNCQNLLIPVEKIVKQNPPGQNTAAIGVPFTWKMNIPVLFDPATGTVSNANGSPNDLHGITIWDDLTTTGADLTFVSERAYWRNTGAPIAHTFSNVGGRLTFDFFPVVPALQQFVIEVTVVLNDTPTNTPGKQFINTAKWDFGRLIDGVYYEPLPGEWGVSPPMTIAAPLLTVTKSGPATMNMGQWGNFALNVQNTGTIDAWNATINDLFPHGTTGGMCDKTPEILSAQVFAADGVTPIAGKGPLTSGSGYSLSYSPAPSCKLDMTMLTAAGTIGPTQRLIISYRAQLDANTQNAVTLTNVAGAIQWYNGDSSNTNRKAANRTLTNGTPGVLDHEDAFNVTTSVSGYFFEKTVTDVTSGANPATTAAPGDKLRYTLRFRTTSQALSNFSVVDDMDALNAQAAFAAGTLTLVSSPTGADISATSGTGGTKGTGLIDIRNLSLPVNGVATIQFDITLKSGLANGTIVTNQARALANSAVLALSDDPNVNGTADPTVAGDEDPTRVTINSTPPSFLVQKISTDLTGDPNVLLPGERLRYTITVKNTAGANAVNVTLRDAMPANTTYVAGSTTLNGSAVADVAGASPLVNGMQINSPDVATIIFDVLVNQNVAAGTAISNQGFVNATGIVDQPSDDPRTPTLNDPTINIVGSLAGPVLVVTKSGPATMSLGQWGSFAVNIQNTGAIDAWNAAIRDVLPQGTTGGMCALTPEILSAQVFAADGVTPVAGKGPLTSGSGYSLSYSAAPTCQLNITMLTAAGTIGPNQRLILRYRTQLDANTQNNVTLTNIAGAIQWFDADSSNASRKSSIRTLSNGTPGTLDHEDAFNVNVIGLTPSFRVQKISTDLTGDPNVLLPGDRLRYTITVKNVGGADAVNAMLRDAVPANTTYVAGSTTLNGAAVADVAGASPLVNGIQINSPANATAGLMPADASSSPANVATIIFDVTVNQNAADGTVISNQGFVNATGIVDQPSDDPRTPTLNDPTINIVGTLGGPVLVVTKSGPATMTLGQWGNFGIDVQNTGPSDAWNAAIRDVLPQGTTGGMCALTPEILSAQVFAADGVTPVAGKGPLTLGSGYSLSYSAAPNCQLNITMLTAAGTIGPNQRLILRYRTQLDSNTQNGVTLTNIAGAIQWFDADSSNASRKSFTRTLTNGTPGIPDHEDAFNVNVIGLTPSFRVQKISTDLTGDPNVLLPGDRLRYTITVKNVGGADAMNAMLRDAVPANTTYVAGSTTLNGAAVADVAGASPLVNGIQINSPANATAGLMPADASSTPANVATLIFDVTVNQNVAGGTVISNQGFVNATGIVDQPSDDPRTPTLNDPTINIVASVSGPVLVVTKSGPATMNLGQWGNFGVDVQNTGPSDAWNATIRDLLPHGTTGGMCTLTPEILSAQVFAADGVTPVAGKGALTAGSDYSLGYNAAPNCQLDMTMLTAAGTIGPNQRLIIRYRTQLDASTQNGVTLTNIAGAIQWFDADSSNTNRKTSTGTLTNGTPGVADYQDAHNVTVALSGYFFDKTIANLTSGVNPATTALPGDKLRYTLRLRTTQALSNFSIVDEMDALNAQPDFAAGTLTLVATPAGADISGTSSTGGTKGTGVIDVRNLSLPGNGSNGEALIQFDITLKSALANDTIVANQSTVRLANGTVFALSDDPNVNGTADSAVSGDEDPTRVKIVSSAVFRVQKISTDLTGDPNVLLAGEKLRYTITAQNISNQDAVNVVLRDAVPANTTYVAGSTTLNGAAVADVAGGSPLVNGMPINSSANATPGLMPAASSSQAVATITFDVTVNPNTPEGTVISNQGVVSATGIVDQPSDDPRTPALNDPTVDIVGTRPALYAEKHVALSGDLSSPGIVDPGDVLRYTITIKNSATVPATGIVLTDPVPANTTYVANSTLLNGSPVPDGGGFPLASGININTLSPGSTALLQYDLRVSPGTPAGTAISNQAVVNGAGLPNLLTDSDGNPANGSQPTVIVVGSAQQISISAQVSVVGGGPAIPGAQLDYVMNIVNTADVPAYNVVIKDDLNANPGQLAYVNQSATVNGSAAGVSFAGSTITVDYGAVSGPLAPGAVVALKFRTTLNSSLAVGTVVTNTGVATWNNPIQTTSASVSVTVGSVVPVTPGTPVLAVLNGALWHDANFDNVQDSGERALTGWTVELYRDNQMSQSVQTDANGVYRIIDVEPNDTTGVRYELRFHAPGEGANTAMLGRAASPFTNGLQRISDIIVLSGANLQGLNLPIHPNGVIYNSATRIPVAGTTLTLLDARSATPLPAACFDDTAQQGQITLSDGYYKFDINFSDPSCPSRGNYLISLTAPGANYVAGYSQTIPPTSNASTAAFSVPACPASAADAIPGTNLFCEVQSSEFAPAASVVARSVGTTYQVHLMLDSSQMPGSSQIFNNHIPIDPQTAGSLSISKTTPLLNVTRGQLVPYVITVNNRETAIATDVSIVDRLPAGFTYVAGSALLDGVPTEPSVVSSANGRTLSWNGLVVDGKQTRTVKLLVTAGAGISEGQFVNRAQAMHGATGSAMSGEATATVRLVPDVTMDCTDVTGKVFNDANRNGWQDNGEEGLPGVRVVTARGLQAMTDQYGRYHVTCAVTPNENRGSNFVLKLDDRTLPSGFRLTTDQLQIQHATRGKALRLNFGASIHRSVSIDLSDAAFEPGKTDIRVQWKPRLNVLLDELSKSPAVLRLSYVADTEDAALVKRRVEAVKRQLTEEWKAASYTYVLTIEPEVFWRRGAPVKRPDVRVPGGK